MPFFEGKQELYQVLCFVIIPATICALFYFLKARKLWTVPFAIIAAFLLVTLLFYPYLFVDLFTGNHDSTTVYWLMAVVPILMAAALLSTFAMHWLTKKREGRK